jgi:acyl carrier protein
MDIESLLLEFIQKELAKGRTGVIKPDDDLLSSGIVDSLGILQLVVFIEQKLKFTVPDEDVVVEHFQSVRVLSDYLAGKMVA